MTTIAPSTSTTATVVSERTGTKLKVKPKINKDVIGDFVTDITLNPYIAPRIISFYAYNMRPNTRMHIFFDNINVDEYCAPANRSAGNTYPTSVSNTADYKSIAKSGDWGTAVYSDANGIVAGQFNVPAAKFRTGERIMQISDVESLTLGGDAHTTISSATFTASNLTVTKKTLTLTTITPEFSFQEVTDQVVGVAKAKGILDVSAYYEPLAQAMTINTPNGEAGIFATSLDVFFKKKPEPLNAGASYYPNGVTVYLCEIDNGYPNGKAILPFSTTHKNWPDIFVSSNASTPTKFTFESPVFLSNNKEYAFIVKPDNNDPDYYVWTANLGDIDVGTGYQVFSQPILGTAFYGATMNQWTALPTEYVKFVLRRANFTSTSATANFQNADLDFIPVENLKYVNTSVGLLPGDIVFQSNTPSTNVTGSFVTNPGSGYNANATVTLSFANGSTSTAYVNSTASGGKIVSLNISAALSDIKNEIPGVTIASPSSINITANTSGVSGNTILISSANTLFSVGDKILYGVPSSNTPLFGLTGNSYYYVTFVNSTGIAVSGKPNGANVYILKTSSVIANNSGVSGNTILISSANSIYNVGDRILYSVPSSNTPLYGFTGNTYYYITFANSSAIALSSSNNGTNVYITKTSTFVANTTKVFAANDTIAITDANSTWTSGDRIFYSVPSGNTPITPLSGNTWYYISFANSTTIKLSSTSGGANIDITDTRTTGSATVETHTLSTVSRVVNETHTLSSIPVGTGETHTITGETAVGYVITLGTPTINSIATSIYGDLFYYDSSKSMLQVDNSTGGFQSNTFIQIHRFPTSNISSPNTATLIAYANSGTIHNPIVDAWVTQVSAITPPGTDLQINYTGTSNNYVKDTNPLPTNIGYETEFLDIQRIVASRSNELTNMGGVKSVSMSANLVTDSSYLSPLIDTAKYNQLVISNQIDPIAFTYEEFFDNGGSKSKHITKVITLADGQDAEDIQVILTAHRPVDTDIQVWVKFQSAADPETIDQKTWTPLININDTIYCDPANPEDFKEYVYTMPKYYSLIPTTGTITASNNSVSVSGTSTKFTTELKVGWFINMKANSTFSEITRKIVSVSNNTLLTLDAPFQGNYTSSSYYLVPPPSTAWMSQAGATKLSGTVTVSSTSTSIVGDSFTVDTSTNVNTSTDSLVISTANSFFNIGDKIYYQVPSGNTAIGGLTGNTSYYIKSANTSAVTLSISTNSAAIDLTSNGTGTHALCKTNFVQEVNIGDQIYVNGDQQQVVGISNATYLSVATPWTSDASGANAYLATREGLSYYNSSLSQFTSYKRFQVKIVLQSDVTARVPILTDFRALALQI